MKSFFKKIGIFILLGIIILIIILNITIKNPNDKLKSYLTSQGFVYNSNDELLKENISEEEYEQNTDATYNAISYNYNKSTFYLINKEMEDGYENVYNLSYNIVNGYMTGDYKKENEYDTWYIETTLNLKTDNFQCDTGGYKGMVKYCDFLKEQMENFKKDMDFYLIGSKTFDYYSKKINK